MSHEAKDSNLDAMPPSQVLRIMLTGMWAARAIQVAAGLGLADALKKGPKSTQELAQMTGTHAASLYRLLRALSSVEIFSEVEPGCFCNTALSCWLQSDRPGSLYHWARWMGTEWEWNSWGQLAWSIQTGQPAFEHIYGMNLWQYQSQENPEAGQLFNLVMTSASEAANRLLLEAYDFSGLQTVVDLGGGHGALLMALLQAYPHLKGILFDLPSVIEEAGEHLRKTGLKSRCQLVAGSFFEAVPSGADAYLLKHILHDWDDECCLRILSNCRQAMEPNDRVLVIEHLILPGDKQTPFVKFLDLQMLLEQTGRERTEAELQALFEASGFKLARVLPTARQSIIEGLAI